MRQIPLGDHLIVTANKTEVSPSGIVLVNESSMILPEQEVLAVGKFVTEIEVGDAIIIDFRKFTSRRNKKSKVAKNPMIPDGVEDTLVETEEVVEIPVYNLDGQDVIVLKQYDILPWKTPKEIIDKSSIVIPKVEISKLN